MIGWENFYSYAKIQKNLTHISYVVVRSQTGRQRDGWADRKDTFQRTTILYTGLVKQAVARCCWRDCFDPNPGTIAP